MSDDDSKQHIAQTKKSNGESYISKDNYDNLVEVYNNLSEDVEMLKESKRRGDKNRPNYISIGMFIIAIISLLVAYSALDLSEKSLVESQEINNYTKIIKQASLQVGQIGWNNNTLIVTLINGYYARYPSFITSGTYCREGNCKDVFITPEGTGNLVKRDEPIELTLAIENGIPDGKHNISLEVRYVDFGDMHLKSTNSFFEVNFSNNNITNVDLNNIIQKDLGKIGGENSK